jgi:hypothetical protein
VAHIVFGNTPYITAYPNPAKTALQVAGLTPGSLLSLVDIWGKTLGQYKPTGTIYAINVQNLAAGVYFIRVLQNGKTTLLKVVKQ